MTSKTLPIIMGLVALVVLSAALFTMRSEERPKVGEDGRIQVTFATDWKAQAEHGGFYQALALGYYANHGLDVQILQGGPGVNIPQMLAAGAVDMGLGSNNFIPLNLVEAGAPVKLSTDAPIDFKRSLAFAPIGTSVGGIFINKSAVPSGEGNAEALKSEIIERLKKTCESLGISVQIHLRHELYSGQHVELAPDIAFEIDDFECDVDSGLNDNFYIKAVSAREIKIALVMRRNSHDRSGAVFHQHEIGHVYRHAPPGNRIDTVGAGKDTLLFQILG